MSSVLEYMALKHHHFIHGGGRAATHFMIDLMELSGDEKVLEIGVGTGSTAIALNSRYPSIKYCGLDVNKTMLEIASRRIRFSKVDVMELHQVSEGEQYPFPDHEFDIVFMESVIGILSAEELNIMIKEVARVLRNGGYLLMNESIWNSEINISRAEEINNFVQSVYGIPQAQTTLLHQDDYIRFFEAEGFLNQGIYDFDSITYKPPGRSIRELRSSLFTFIGRFKKPSGDTTNPTSYIRDDSEAGINDTNKYLHAVILQFKRMQESDPDQALNNNSDIKRG